MNSLIATLGPASLDRAAALAAAGATAFRLNASHLDADALRAALASVRAQAPRVPVVVDLQGAKMRLGGFPEISVAARDRLAFALNPTAGDLPLPHPEFFRAAAPGETLSADDGKLRFRVLAAGDGRLEVEALTGGVLRPRKGVNLMEHPVRLEAITPGDAAKIAAAGPGVAFAFSFMEDGHEAAWLRARAPGSAVIGKVERQEAIDAMGSIAAATDAIWICRGDLGEQLGPARLARFVAGFDPRSVAVPVLMAGQVLQHLADHGEPTRSEVCHLHDLLARGYAGIVLSDETAIGVDPTRAVRIAAELLEAMRVQPRQ